VNLGIGYSLLPENVTAQIGYIMPCSPPPGN